jgi:Insulinase (Peptidase family M16)
MEIRHSRLASGLQVITARLPGFSSAAGAAAVNAGSRHETKANNGVAHFLEHMRCMAAPVRPTHASGPAARREGPHEAWALLG